MSNHSLRFVFSEPFIMIFQVLPCQLLLKLSDPLSGSLKKHVLGGKEPCCCDKLELIRLLYSRLQNKIYSGQERCIYRPQPPVIPVANDHSRASQRLPEPSLPPYYSLRHHFQHISADEVQVWAARSLDDRQRLELGVLCLTNVYQVA